LNKPTDKGFYDLDLLKLGYEGERGITQELFVKYGINCAPKSIIIQEGEVGSEVYMIISGKVVVCEKLQKGSYKVVAALGPGEIFGEMAVLEGKTRSATLIAKSPVKLLKLSKEDFNFIMKTHPRWAFKLLGALAKRITNTFFQISEHYKGVR
jgi:CRP-like cAMP-binding protein